MRVLGNIIWLILGGLLLALAWFLIGAILCVTIIGIPFGLQCFKIGRVAFLPFGKDIDINFMSHPIGNVIWVILVGWGLFTSYLTLTIVYGITIIGIPFAMQTFKLAVVGLVPMGAEIK